MELRTLGTTGVAVSAYALGTTTFGAEADEAASHAMLDRYLDAGGNFVDGADVYAEGASEEIIGCWLQKRGRRDDVVLATKARFRMGGGPNDLGLSRLHLKRACEASLRRLGTETIDLYQAHCWDPATPIEETLAEMLPWSPLGGGWLTGKYSRGERPSGATRLGEDPDRGQEGWDRRNTERTWAVIEAVQEIAGALGASMAQVALAWVTGRPGVTSTILGTRTVEQLDDNLGAARLELEPEQVARLDDVSDPGLPAYPYGFIEEMSEDRMEVRNG